MTQTQCQRGGVKAHKQKGVEQMIYFRVADILVLALDAAVSSTFCNFSFLVRWR